MKIYCKFTVEFAVKI